MSLTPSFGDKIAKQLVALYAKSEEQLLTFLAKTLAGERGHGANWMARMTLKIGPVRVRVQKILDKLQGDSRAMVTEAIREAWERGRQAAIDDIPGTTVPVYNIDGAAAEQAEEVARKLEETRPRAELAVTNRYREIIDEVTRDQKADSEAARKRLVQAALDKFAADGITAFVDKNGRRYDLVSYTEMAVRAAITEAEVESYTRQLVHAGIDLVIVSDVPQACTLCEVFEGKILSITGATRAAIWADPETGETRRVPVFASIPEAKARGLWHPGCRHVLSAWTPKDPFPPQADTPDPQGYRDSQRLRALERRVRKWKRVRAVATTREAELNADRRIALAQRDIREHVARTGVRRQRDREQLHRGYSGTPDAIALDAERRARERKTVDELVDEIRQERGE
ncbi:phage minor capsid protein [Rhodococcus rhodochrous]|uniref:phage minor capsid protein n=2 Tax=Rhodococcus TaxID=1827 RepID=UPI001E490613|nr:phage minor capsid protein [Rhodococcus rhodochrous]MCD2099542.1 phage minor capsid protein [Rhodococcus rhodochrous]MCD2123910.1 phage minor capsid protein [Rhodococcus rhodochrous]MCQ4136663.1 phage minor capsid protein [Rhodococcus rhodochrous]